MSDPATGKLVQRLTGHTSSVFAVQFSPDGKTLASASFDGTVRLWSPATGAQLGRVGLGTDPIYSVAFSTDGRSVLSGAADHAVRLWEKVRWRDLDELHATVCDVIVAGLRRPDWVQYAPGIAYRRSCP